MRVLILTCLTVLLSFSTPSFATSYKTVSVKVSASGATEDKAITKALGLAVQQANGTQVNVQSTIRDTDQGIVVDWLGNQTVIPSQEVNTGFTSAKSGGLIQSYKVLSSQYLKDANMWKVTIDAQVAKYANIGADRSGLLQLVVFPFRTLERTYDTVSGSTPAPIVSNDLNQRITNEFVQSGKFRVLDRSFWEESNVEELIVSERSYATQESIKLGQKLGADYMVVGTINDFDISRASRPMYGAVSTEYQTTISIQLRVIEVATSDIIASSTFAQTFDPRQLTQKMNELRKNSPLKNDQQLEKDLQNYIYDQVSHSISLDVMARINGTTPPPTETTPAGNAPTREAKPLTPGSSEQPLKWN